MSKHSQSDSTFPEIFELLSALDNAMLGMISSGAATSDVLSVLSETIEKQSSGLLCSILLLDPDRKTLRHAAAPSLPQSYVEAIDGVAIGPNVGSCGTAAFRGEAVFSSDIACDPLWTQYRELALSHGLRACWSTPIMSRDGTVLGTFAMYYREPRSPSTEDLQVIEGQPICSHCHRAPASRG